MTPPLEATISQGFERGANKPPSFSKPRLGFLGVGWIGRHRMEAMSKSGLGEIVAIADPVETNSADARKLAPSAEVVSSIDALLEMELDGLVIATPSALHADQCIQALEHGISVFCQKPLARAAAETRRVIDAARAADRLLAVDLSYRFTDGMQRIRELVRSGELGQVFAVDLVFHNAYGPDKAWFYDPALSGGGCLIDLGIHLVDLACWVLGTPDDYNVTGQLFAGGQPLRRGRLQVEDFASAQITLNDSAIVQLACSWRLHAGCDAVIRASFYGTKGGAEFRNVNGSFYHFQAHHFRGTTHQPLATGLEDWGGRAAVDWLSRLAADDSYDPAVEELITVAEILDRIYGR